MVRHAEASLVSVHAAAKDGVILLDVLLDNAGLPDGIDLAWRPKQFLGTPVPGATAATVNLAQVVTAVELEPSDSEEKQDDPADPVQADPAQSNPIGSGVDLSRGRPMPMGPSMQVQPQAPLPNSARGKTHGAIVSLRIEMAAYFRRPPIAPVETALSQQ